MHRPTQIGEIKLVCQQYVVSRVAKGRCLYYNGSKIELSFPEQTNCDLCGLKSQCERRTGMEQTGIDFAAMPQTAIKVITSPATFFREMKKTGGFVEPLVFMAIMGVVAGLVQAVLAMAGLSVGVGVGMAIAVVFIYPIAIAILGFIGAAIIFVIWKLMGSQEPYETAYRCMAYLTALWPITTALGAIPYIGIVLTIAIMTYFYVIVSVEAHKIPSQRAWLVFGIIGAALILMGVGAEIAKRALQGKMQMYQQQMEGTAKEMQKSSEAMKKALEQMQKQQQQQGK
jgi:hypothetical protein